MKNLFRVITLGVLLIFFFTACAKQPTQEMDNTKAAVENVKTAKAEIYAKDEFKKLNDDLTAALDEVTAQSKKLFKKYGKAKEMLVKVKSDADALVPVIAQRKDEAKKAALAAQTEATAAVTDAKGMLKKAPAGKGTKADIEALKADLKALEESLPEVQKALDTEDYYGAADKAKAIKEKAAGISDQVKKAIEKARGKAPAKAPAKAKATTKK
jgi:ElaB/YqjD/DUF883 family membrane-anchored ribosome-binding protein